MKLDELEGERVLILGFGREGRDTLLFLRKKFPPKNIGIADQKYDVFHGRTKRVILHLGKNYLKAIRNYDIIIKSPGIPLACIKPFLTKHQILTSQTNIFLSNCSGTVVGVTGTKGKSTTSSMIYHVLKKKLDSKVRLIGNIEEPALKFLDRAAKEDVFVYELSSAQLELATKSPHIAVFLNLYPEHLDHHGSFKAYARSKANITKFQTKEDFLIFNQTDPEIRRIASTCKATLLPFVPKRERSASYAAALQPVFLVSKLFGISSREVQHTLKSFRPLPHRLQLVGTYKGITFYNDSLATIPQATIAALDILGSRVATLIVGGYDRGVWQHVLAERILKSDVRTLILLPTTGKTVQKELEMLAQRDGRERLPIRFWASTMAEAVKLCYKHTFKGKICLLSPAAASFNLFSNYKHRGEEFIRWVKCYAQKAPS